MLCISFGENLSSDLPDHGVFMKEGSVFQPYGIGFYSGDPKSHLFVQGAGAAVAFNKF